MRHAPFALAVLASVSALAFAAPDAIAAKSKSNHSFSGGIEVGFSTDRNAGSGGGGIRSASKASDDDEDDEDEDDDDDDDDDAFGDDDAADIGDDVLDDLDLEDDDFADDLDDLEDEADGEVDLDGDGIVDGTEDDPDVADAADDAADPDAFVLRGSAKKVKIPPKTVRDERMTTKASIGHKYAMGKNAWKSGLSYTNANQRDLDKNDNYILALGTGPEFKLMNGDLTLNPSVAYARLNKDSKHIFDTYAASFGVKYKINKKVAVKSKYTYSMQNFESSKLDDTYGQKIALGLGFKPTKTDAGEIGYSFKTSDVTPASKEKDQHQIGLKYQHDFPMKIYIVGETAYKWTDADAPANNRVPAKEDEEYTFGLSLGKEVYKDITLELQYDSRNVSTNIPNKDTSNDRFALVGAWKL